NTVKAAITDNSLVETATSVSLTALDTADITAEVVSVAASVSASGSASVSMAVAITLADNEIGSHTSALIDHSVVHSGSSLTLEAQSQTAIDAVAAAVSVSVSASGGFSLSGAGTGANVHNTTTNVVEAQIRNASTVTAPGNVNL